MNSFIPVNEPLIGEAEKSLVLDALERGWISSEGSAVADFEGCIAKLCNRKFAVAVSSGTAALDCAFAAIDIKPGDEIIVPSFTIISCITYLLRVGAKPVFIDCTADTWTMDVTKIEEKITSKTAAVLMVHIYGLPADVDAIEAICEQHGITLIEDAAEAIGQTYYEKACGSFGKISTLSFYANKHLTTGEGGMVLTDDVKLVERLRSLRNLCFDNDRRFRHYELGFNYRLTALQACVGLGQFTKLKEFIDRKKKIGAAYQNALLGLSDYFNLPLERTSYASNHYWVFGVVIRDEINCHADQFIRKLNEYGVGSRPFFFPLHKQPVLTKYGLFDERINLPVVENIADRGFYLPSGIALTDLQINEVAVRLRSVVRDLC